MRLTTFVAVFIAIVTVQTFAVGALPVDPVANLPEYGPESWKDSGIKGIPGEMLWADCFGPYVMIGQSSDVQDSRTIWNLKERKIVCTIAGKFEIQAPYALSPSGKYFAASRGFIRGDNIAIFDCAKGKPLYELKGTLRNEDMRYLADDKLAVMSKDAIAVWDMKTGKYFGGLRIPGTTAFGAKVFVSPNLKMVGQTNGMMFKLYTPEGKELGEYECPKHELIGPRIYAAEYSPDGKTLALLVTALHRNVVYAFDLATEKFGEPIYLWKELGFTSANRSIRHLSWSLDGKVVLVEQETVVDPFARLELWKFPNCWHTNNCRYLLSAQRGFYGNASGGVQSLCTIDLSDKRIAEIRKSAENALPIPQVNLPPLTNSKLDSVRVAEFPEAVAYTAKPTQVKVPAKIVQPITFATLRHEIGKLTFAKDRDTIAVELLSEPLISLGHVQTASRIKSTGLELFNVTNGTRTAQMEFHFSVRFQAISPDGRLVAVTDPESTTRFDILTVQPNEPVVAIKPYSDKTHAKIEFIQFATSDRLITSNGETIVVWKLPGGQPDVLMTSKPHKLSLSPSGKLLAILESDRLKIVDSVTLSPLGEIDFPAGKDRQNLAFLASNWSLDETLFLTMHQPTEDYSGGVISRFKIDTGKAMKPVRVPFNFTPEMPHAIQPITPEYYLLDNNKLFSITNGEIIWAFGNLLKTSHSHEIYGGHWYGGIANHLRGILYLQSTNMSILEIEQWVKTIDFTKDVIWQTGSDVSLNLNFPGDSEAVKKNLTANLTRKGYKVVEMSKNVLEVSVTVSDTGRKQDYETVNLLGQRVGDVKTLSIKETKGKARLIIDGIPIWDSSFQHEGSAPSYVALKDGEDLDEKVNSGLKNAADGWASLLSPPSKIVTTRQGYLSLPGHGFFSSKGTSISPPVIKVKP